jgi:hypothetical protein
VQGWWWFNLSGWVVELSQRTILFDTLCIVALAVVSVTSSTVVAAAPVELDPIVEPMPVLLPLLPLLLLLPVDA